MKGLTLIFLLCSLLLTVSCSSSSSGTGVAACDTYLAQVEKCANNPNVPEEAKNEYKKNLEKSREDMKKLASTAEGKTELEKQCKAMMDAQKSLLEICNK
jgi:hypothetical protein